MKNTASKKIISIVSACIAAIFIVVFIVLIILSMGEIYDYDNKLKMFESISDFDFLDEYIVDESIELDKNMSDEHARHLVDSKTVKIDYNGSEINVLAYVFQDANSCLDYVKSTTGNEYDSQNNGSISMYYYTYFSFLCMINREKLVVFSDNKVYVVSSRIPERTFNGFIDYFINKLPNEFIMSSYWLLECD